MMKVEKLILDLARVVADQAERDPAFAERIAIALGVQERRGQQDATSKRTAYAARPKNRRPAATLDPIALAREGEENLRLHLSALSLEQLKDIVADHGMDPGRLVMKWKDADRIADQIVKLSLARARKGDAFRPE